MKEHSKQPLTSYSITSVKRCIPISILLYDLFSLGLFIHFCFLTTTAFQVTSSIFTFFRFSLHLMLLYSCLLMICFIICYSLLIFFKPVKYRLLIHTFTENNVLTYFAKLTFSLIRPRKLKEHRTKKAHFHRHDFDEIYYTKSHITFKRHNFPIHKLRIGKKNLPLAVNFIKHHHKPDFIETKKY